MHFDLDATTPFRRGRSYALVATTAVLGISLGVLRFSNGAQTAALTDFHAFYATSSLIQKGAFIDAYHSLTMHAAEQALGRSDSFLPWSYPPQFGLVVAPFAYVPIPLAYLMFETSTFFAFLFALWRLAGNSSPTLMLVVLPSLFLNLISGQNGFLTGALIALFCSLWLRRSASSGITLGLMIIKPHLAIGAGLYVVMRLHWRVAAVAACTCLGTTILASALFGTHIWLAFLHGMLDVRVYLETGRYPFFRMPSLYAAVRSFGLSALDATIAQLCCASMGMALVVLTAVKVTDEKTALGIVVLSSLFLSPYLYDYDLTLVAVALALLAPSLSRRSSRGAIVVLAALSTVATGEGLAWSIAPTLHGSGELSKNGPQPAIAAIAMIFLLMTVLWSIRKEFGTTPQMTSLESLHL